MVANQKGSSIASKEQTIQEILVLEFQMFQAVNQAVNAVHTVKRAPCQDDRNGFEFFRGAQFSIWSKDTLCSYLGDLRVALRDNHNLLTEKYAYMEGLLPPPPSDPLRDELVEIFRLWQEQMVRKYPTLMARARPVGTSSDVATGTSFETYLGGELATYSARTLLQLHRDVSAHLELGENLTEEIYAHMVRQLGYATVQEAEEAHLGKDSGNA